MGLWLGRTEVNVKEGCVGTLHEDLLRGAVERLIHEINAISDHGADPLGEALEEGARMQEGGPPGSASSSQPLASSKFLPSEALGLHASLWVHPCLHLEPQTRLEELGPGDFQKGSMWTSSCLPPAPSL